MIFRRLYVLQAFEKSASILAQGALSWDIMYLHVFQWQCCGRTFPNFIVMVQKVRNTLKYRVKLIDHSR